MKNLTLAAASLAALGLIACQSTSSSKYVPPSSSASGASGGTGSSQTSTAASTTKEAGSAAKTSMSSANMSVATLAFPTGDEATSALLLEKMAPKELQVGQTFQYQIQVTNLTSMDLDNVVVTDLLSDDIAIQKMDPPAAATKDGVSTWNLGTFRPNESKAIIVSGSPKKAGSISTCASVAYDSGLCMTVPVVAPALQLALKGPAQALLCDTIELVYTVKNSGSGVARNVVVEGTLPAGLQTEGGRDSFTSKIGDLASGQSRDLIVKAKATKTGAFTNGGSANAEGGLTAKATDLTTTFTRPVLKIEKTGTAKSFVGRMVKYEIKLTNTGDAVSEATIVEDAIPSGLSFKSATEGGKVQGGKVRWNLGAIKPGESKALEVSLLAESLGSVRNKATASGECADAVSAEAATEIVGIPAILLEVIDLEDPIEVGTDLTYEIVVTNQGSAPATGVKVNCVVPANCEYVSGSGATAASASGNTIDFAPVGSIAPGKNVTFRVVLRGKSAADARFKVAMTSDQLSSPVEESEATNYYE